MMTQENNFWVTKVFKYNGHPCWKFHGVSAVSRLHALEKSTGRDSSEFSISNSSKTLVAKDPAIKPPDMVTYCVVQGDTPPPIPCDNPKHYKYIDETREEARSKIPPKPRHTIVNGLKAMPTKLFS